MRLFSIEFSRVTARSALPLVPLVPMVALAGALAACADAITAAPSEFPVRFSVSNNLIAPITISIDGTPYIALSGGQSSPVTVSSKVELLKWTSAKPMDAHGTPIPDDVGEIRVGVGGINGVLDITNVICTPRASCVASVPKIAALIKKARDAKVPLIYSQTTTAGSAILP